MWVKLITAVIGMHPTVQVLIILATYSLIKGGYIVINKKKVKTKNIQSVQESHTGDIKKHTACGNFPSLILLVKNAINKMAEIQRILINITISEQMTEFDDLFVDFIKVFKSEYLSLYRKKTKRSRSGLLNEKDVQHYIAILLGMEKNLKGLTRRFMKKNHFLEKSEEEFRVYFTDRAEDYQNEITGYLDEHYDSSLFEVSREELYEWNHEHCRDQLLRKVERFFYKARTISAEQRDHIKELEKGIEDFV